MTFAFQTSMRSFRLAAASTLVVVTFSGCAFLMVPVPWRHGNVRTGKAIHESEVAPIRVGGTSRSEVVAELGPPGRRFEDLCIDAYGWTDVSWYFPWMFVVGGGYGGAGAGGIGERWQRHVLVIRYDAKDLVERIGFRVCGGNETIGECVHAWADEGGPLARSPTLEPHAVLNVHNSEKRIRVPVEVLVDGELAAELPGGTWKAIKTRPGIRSITVAVRAEPNFLGGSCSLAPARAFALRLQEGQPQEIDVGLSPAVKAGACPPVRWGISRIADGVEARKSMREVW